MNYNDNSPSLLNVSNDVILSTDATPDGASFTHKEDGFDMDPEMFREMPSIHCHLKFLKTEYPTTDSAHGAVAYCNSTWDHVSCWPTSPGDTRVSIACPSEVQGVFYDTSQNASRYCYGNGTWEELSDYNNCTQIIPPLPQDIHTEITRIIRHVGCACSVVALLLALFIFTYFRSLRCLRNKIHCHLIVSFILRNVCWLILEKIVTSVHGDIDKEWLCKLCVFLYTYFQVTNFFWMFVEGLFLHTMICWAYSADKIKIWYYNVIGWGIPVLICVTWALVKWQYEDDFCWLPSNKTHYDLVYIAPILAALFVNLIFLGTILWVLILKLQATNTLQTKQYKKAVKALLVLIPLFGLTYILFLLPYGNKIISMYCNAIVSSTQGLAVAVFYCFLNGEVRHAIKTRLNRWRDHRNMAASKCPHSTMVTYSPQMSTRKSQTISVPKLNDCSTKTTTGRLWTRDTKGEPRRHKRDSMATTPMLEFEKVT